ncbi:hypothetical protein MD484_g838, partial [Candolleomyces efflorescens]
MRLFNFARSTRSGVVYNPFPVVPVAAPPNFELRELLEQAVRLEDNEDLSDDL